MKFAVAVSTETNSQKALDELCREASQKLAGSSIDLALLFLSQHHAKHFDWLSQAVQEKLTPKVFLGATNAGIIGGEQEVEGRAGMSLWLAHLPKVQVTPFHLTFNRDEQTIEGWPELMPLQNDKPAFLLIPDPFSIPADEIVAQINQDYPGSPVVGGMASAASQPGENRLFLNGEIYTDGAIGVVFTGNIEIRTVVSQGCRPVGKPFVVTQADKNVIQTLGGKPALQQLQELFTTLAPADQQLFRQGLHVGIVVDEMKEKFQRGDFIVRNVMGIDPESGSVAIGDYVRKGQSVQFHVRDASSAREDLNLLLRQKGEDLKGASSPTGALMFSCNGRGMHLFGEPNHDISALREILGSVPTAGFFAAGEIGPIGGKNFLHGFTASIALFCEKS